MGNDSNNKKAQSLFIISRSLAIVNNSNTITVDIKYQSYYDLV